MSNEKKKKKKKKGINTVFNPFGPCVFFSIIYEQSIFMSILMFVFLFFFFSFFFFLL